MSRLKTIKGVLIDLSGTLHIEDQAIPGAVEAIKRLKESGLKVRFTTNTTKESRRLLHERLVNLGFFVESNEIFTSLTAARDVIVNSGLTRPYLMLDKRALEDFEGSVELDVNPENADSVVIGLSPSHFNHDCLNKAFHCLMKGVPLIGIHKARYYKRSDGLALGPGPFIVGLQYATDVEPIVVGKPEKKFFLDAINPFGLEPSEVAMIGDDVRDDVGGAQAAGFIGILVQTGKYCLGDETKIKSKPDFVFPSVVEAINAILKK